MDTKLVSMVSGAALLALPVAASAGPMPITNSKNITPPTQIEQAHYYRHHYRHYGWSRHRHHYGWRYGRYRYGYGYNGYYGWNPAAAAVAGTALGLATLPFAVAGGWPYYGYRYGPYYGYG
jgi:hypothetical protein